MITEQKGFTIRHLVIVVAIYTVANTLVNFSQTAQEEQTVSNSQIQKISIAKLRADDNAEIAKLIEATINVGFFYAVEHDVDTQTIRQEAQDFFGLS